MKTLLMGSTALLLLAACAENDAPDDTSQQETPAEKMELSYPEARTVDQTDDFYGTTVADPYRWLETDVRESEEVAEWVTAQNEVTNAYLETLSMRDVIKARMMELWDYERFTIPVEEGGHYFYRRNDGLQNQYVYYVQEGLDGEPRALIDPNGWSDDGATALAATSVSPGGAYVAYAIQDGGSDWRTVKVLNVETGETMDDAIEWVKFSGLSWHPDGTGFYYSRFPAPEEGETFQSLNFNQKLYFHQLGTEQSEDKLVFERADNPEVGVFGYVISKRFLIVGNSLGTDDAYEIAVQDLVAGDDAPTMIIEGFEDDYSFIGAEERVLYVQTNRNASKGRVVAIDLDNPAEENWEEIIPETDNVLTDVTFVDGKFLAEYMRDVASVVLSYSRVGEKTGEIELPGLGTASGFDGSADASELFYSYSSFNRPSTIYRMDVTTGESSVFKEPDLTFDPDDYVVEQVFYPSKDGTEIPMFLVFHDDYDTNGPMPTQLYAYGGFNISQRPRFKAEDLAWMEMGGLYALANIRGGGEYGREWHDGGRLANKQNVFDDFIAAGEWLIEEGATTKEQLAIRGRSNGGLLVGTVTNQRPDLFAAALPQVGVMDMLRFNMFTAGRYWTDDYGNPSESEADFKINYAYSPYHNIQDGVDYPAVLVTTADTDDRVVPGHSFKYTAALQAVETGDAPKLIRIETRAGHGSGKPTDKLIEEFADMWAFIGHHTGLELPVGYGE